jgi:hypothetical protein
MVFADKRILASGTLADFSQKAICAWEEAHDVARLEHEQD